MLLFISLLSACTVFCLIMSIRALRTPEKVDVSQRLQGAIGIDENPVDIREMELQRSFSDRALRPLLGKLSHLVTRFFPGTMVANLQPKLNRAGNPGEVGAEEFLALKFLGVTLLAFLAISVYVNRGADFLSITFFLLVVAGGWFLPDAYLQSLSRRRIEEIDRSMPDVLDLLTVCVEAGYSWDGALQKVVQKRKGPLSMEFRRVLHEARMGKPRREALRDLSDRIQVPSLTTFVAAVIQADQLGLSLGQVLRTQSDHIRQKRRQEIEEEAMKAPVKILIPLVFFVFPAIFIILLGPAMVQIIEIF